MTRRYLAPLLLAAALLLAQVTAFAHEYQHSLHQHDAPCALHVLGDQLGNAPVAASSALLPEYCALLASGIIAADTPQLITPAYHGRAPPSSRI
jgi:hypothetical protein